MLCIQDSQNISEVEVISLEKWVNKSRIEGLLAQKALTFLMFSDSYLSINKYSTCII